MPLPEITSDTYTDGGIYSTLDYGSIFASKGLKFARWLQFKDKMKILSIGCGMGHDVIEFLNQGHDAYGTELHKIDIPILKNRIVRAIAPNLPFRDKEFDHIHCCEVLEHIPSDLTDVFLDECRRIGKAFLFSVATAMDDWKTHINLHSASWWYDKFVERGYRILNFQYKPVCEFIDDIGESKTIWMPEGVMLIAT